MNYLLMFLSGVLLCNAIPHLTSGLRGETFFVPWSRVRESALVNVLWGNANLFIALFILSRISGNNIPHGAKVAAIGFVLTAIALSVVFARRPRG